MSFRAYQETVRTETQWMKHVYTGHDHDVAMQNVLFSISSEGPVYIAGLMVFFDEVKPYSNSPSVKLVGLPTASTGLPAGSLWSNGGVLTVA